MSKRKTLQRRAMTKLVKAVSKLTSEQIADVKRILSQQLATTTAIIETSTLQGEQNVIETNQR
jgi:hypothetical protein